MSTLEKAIKLAIQNQMIDYYTALPGKVESYDYKLQKATIKPLLRQKYSDGSSLEIQPITAVPVMFPSGYKSSLTFPIKKGVTGLILFCSRSIDTWLSNGGIADIDSIRLFDLSDAVFIPGLNPFTEKSNSENDKNILLYYDGFKLKIDDSGKIAIGKGSNELLDLIDQLLDALIQSVVPTPAGPQQLSKVTDQTVLQIKNKLSQIKGSL